MKKIAWLFILLFTGCLKLDNNLYNNKSINEYRLDAYDGEQDFVLDASYDIPQNLVQIFTLNSRDASEDHGVAIQVLYIGDQARINTDTVILYCHGNKWHMDFYWQRAKLLAHINGKNRYGVMMLDYRGYGLSEGEPTETGMYADVDACLRWLQERGLTNARLVLYGFSLGTAPVCELSANARTLRPSRIVLEAPFASAAVMVADASQLDMPADYFTDLKIDNAEEIKKVDVPFLWLHGKADMFLNYETHGRVVYNNYKGPHRTASLCEGADHGEVPLKMGFHTYLDTLGRFMRR